MTFLFLIILPLFLMFPSIAWANVKGNDSRVPNGAILLGAIESSGINLKATGYDWVEYSADEKFKFMAAMFAFYKLDGRYNINKAVNLLDVHYYQAQKIGRENPELDADVYLSAPCLWTFGAILSDKETDWGVSTIKNP